MITIRVEAADEIERKLERLERKADTIMSRAANRAATTAAKGFRKDVSGKYRTKSTTVGKEIRIDKATRSNPTARVLGNGEHIGLEKYTVSPMRRVKVSGGGTTKRGKKRARKYSPKVYKAAVKRGSGIRPLDGDPKPFVAQMKNGHVGVFERKSPKGTRQIKSIFGPAVPQMMKNKDILNNVEKEAGKVLEERIMHEIDYEMKTGV